MRSDPSFEEFIIHHFCHERDSVSVCVLQVPSPGDKEQKHVFKNPFRESQLAH
jgi:hypothetical protein